MVNKVYMFLSPEWIREAVRTIQSARARDEEFRKLTSDYSLSVAYIIKDIPSRLKEQYSNERIVLFIRLDEGVVRELKILNEPPIGADFTITSTYSTVKQIFSGQLSLASAFMNRQVRVEPFDVIYRRPRFAAKSLIVGNMIIKLISQIPTEYPE
jgi:putative sterol carrier protein